MSDLPERVEAAIATVLPRDGFKALHEPRFAGNEWRYVKECIDTGWVSSAGKFVDRFEQELAAYTGAAHAIAVANGTAALHVALQLAGVKSGDEVLVPALTFAATASAVAFCGATPHFVDSEERTLGLDAAALRRHLETIADSSAGACVDRRTGRPIRAVVPMHTFGHPVAIDEVLAVARDFDLAVVEDAAESLGSLYRERHTGTFGPFGTLSFNGNKTITTGGGGAILTDDADLAKRAKHLTRTAKVPHRWEYFHDEVGYNYRLPNLNAALGCAQLEQLPGFVESKRRLYGRYAAAFVSLSGARLFPEPEHCRSNYWLQTLLLDEDAAAERDAVLARTNDAGFMTRPAWTLLDRLPMYRGCPKASLPVAESLARRIVNLPSSPGLV